MSILAKIFGDSNERYIKSLGNLVEEINSYEPEYAKLPDSDLKNLTQEFRVRLKNGQTLDDILPQAYAVVREAAKRTLGQRHFDVQLIGGIILHQGKIAEMKTGEGKTLVATLPLYLNSLTGKGAHLVTPNDYLSRVGAGWMGPVYSLLGVSAGVITHDFSGIFDLSYKDPAKHDDSRLSHFRPCSRQEAYQADITYGTNNEFGFDYLRDNLEYSQENLRHHRSEASAMNEQGFSSGYHYAIVDEIDSILIDEARTPLIISMPDQESAELYGTFSRITPQLKENEDYNVDEKFKAVSITEAGIDKVEKILGIENIYEEKGIRFVHHLEQALRAKALFQRDRDYVVKDGEVIIVDEFTGRLMPGRRWSEGLHQAVEAKEGVRVQQESRTIATITFQNYFRMYEKLSGMTGTAETSAEEFHKVYNLEVVSIPTNKPMIRQDFPDSVFRTEKGKFQAVIREIKEKHEKGQPVLVGTVSIEKNEKLSRMLQVEGVPHEVLNAKNHEREAMIIAQAGKKGVITIATNMAGRGVDIILGGTLDLEIQLPSHGNQLGNDTSKKLEFEKEKSGIVSSGGLYVIGTERHEARRIDNQLRGRSGRQGDPGSSRFFVSMEDDLMRIFGSDKIKRMMESFGIPEDQPIENKMITRAIESAQSKIEGFHFDARKHILEYDDVLNKQRDAIYKMRREILMLVSRQMPSLPGSGIQKLKDRILEMFEESIIRLVEFHTQDGSQEEWNLGEIFETMRASVGVTDEVLAKLKEIVFGELTIKITTEEIRQKIIDYLLDIVKKKYDDREKEIGEEGMRNIERAVMLRTIDMLWMDHLDQMEHLRDSVRLRAYGQRDPLVEYKNEGIRLFRELQTAIQTQIVNTIFKVGGIPNQQESRRVEAHPQAFINKKIAGMASLVDNSKEAKSSQVSVSVGRNDPCPCGSGKKYKRCHGQWG